MSRYTPTAVTFTLSHAICVCVYTSMAARETLRVACKWIMADRKGTELTTVVLDGDVFTRQLVLASHTNEQWASSPAGEKGPSRRRGRDGGRQRKAKIRLYKTHTQGSHKHN